MILVGTSGYSYSDWVGPFYPEGTKRDGMLEYYTTRFSLAELDFTYYQMPGRRTMEGLARKTPPGFRFAVKANKQMTHAPELASGERRAICRSFQESLTPLMAEGKTACILLQFPYAFRRSPANEALVATFRDHLADVPLVVEFRHQSWVGESVFAFLRDHAFNFCCVDEPELPGLFPRLAVATGSLAYLRFHGRNKAKWWNHQTVGERYDYLYSDQELKEWVPKVRRLDEAAETVMVLFNNCHFGQAARNALRMQALLFEE